jgi:hypothetical protein
MRSRPIAAIVDQTGSAKEMLICCSSSTLRRRSLDSVSFPQRFVYFAGDPQFVH